MTEINQEELQKEQEQEVQRSEQQRLMDAAETEEAAGTGWVPEDDFRGDPKLWRPAREWNERAKHIMPIMKATNKRLEETVSTQTKKLSEMTDMVGRMVKVQEKHSDDLYDGRIADLETQKRQAVEDGDTALYDRLVSQSSTIEKPEPVKIEESSAETENGTQLWVDDNRSWYGQDTLLTDAFNVIGDQLAKEQNPLAVPGKEYEFGELIKKRIQTLYPDKFKNPNRENGSGMDESETRGGEDNFNSSNGEKGWNDLPQAAQQQFSKIARNMEGKRTAPYTKEEYVKEYFELEGGQA